MYIIYNADGSIKKINLTDYIQKGNNNVNSIFLAIEGKTNAEWEGTIYALLPDGTKEGPITPTNDTETIDGVSYSGFVWSISANVTAFEGLVYFSLKATTLGGLNTLFTYLGKIVINPASAIPNETKINVAQYEALRDLVLQVLNDAATKDYVDETIAAAFGEVEEELEELDVGGGV